MIAIVLTYRARRCELGELLNNRNFCIYFAGRLVSVVGDSCYSVALILAVLQATHSVTSGASVLIAGTIPVVLLTLIGGTLGDRLPRNVVMLASDLMRSGTQCTIALLLLRSHPPLWALIATQFLYGIGDAFFGPASTGLLPEIVAPEELPAANSLLQLSASSAIVVGPAIAGMIVAVAGAPVAIAIDAVSFLASALSLSFLTLPKSDVAPARDSMVEQLKVGLLEIRKRRWALVTACYLAFLAFAFDGPIFVLGPAVALSRLGGPSAWSLMLCAFGIGLIAGTFVARRLLRTSRPLGWAYVANLALVPLLSLLGTSHSKWLVAVSSSLAGLAVGTFSVTYPTLLQQTVPTDVLSRVGSYFWLAGVAATPLAFAIVGPLSERFGISTVFDVAALSICVVTLVSAALPEVWSIQPARRLSSTQSMPGPM